MKVSQARIDANRKNSLKSTGPKTAEGKERSRANALKHGLCASVVVAEDAEVVRQRAEDFFNTLRPQNDFHCWIVTEVALDSVRIDRVERMERRVRDKIAIKAETTWDADRRLEAALLGRTICTRPDVVVEQLCKTPHGCEWLMTRWAMLAHAADVNTSWNEEQTDLAFDLLGTPREFRKGQNPGVLLDNMGRVIDAGESSAAVARREIAALEGRRELVIGLDEANRALAAADLSDDADPELRRLRRYESTLHGRLRWCLAQLRVQSPTREPLRHLRISWLGQEEPRAEVEIPEPEVSIEISAEILPEPAPLPLSEPEPQPEAVVEYARPKEIHPPFDLEDDECPAPGEELDIPKILASRREKSLIKAENRRNARRRKVEAIYA